jgi:sortase A
MNHGTRKLAGRRIWTVIVVLSVMCVVAAVVLAARIGWFLVGSSFRGAFLVHQERRDIAAAERDPRACQALPVAASGKPGNGPNGLLEIPALKLVAPVLAGTSDAVLGEAVGHVTGSAWPGQPGTSVLSAHDVTWFSRIGGLRPGDLLKYVTPCRTYTFQVTGHQVVAAGSPVYTTAASEIVLDTCYPFNALYLTSTRYLVYGDLTRAEPTSPLAVPPPGPPAPRVPAPAQLAAEGLDLDHNRVPLGTLTLTGSPSASWRQSGAPIAVEAAALTAYFGAIRSAEQGKRSWWADLAPSVSPAAAAPVWRGDLSGYGTPLSITLRVDGGQAAGATLSALVTTRSAGTFDLSVRETLISGTLLVTGFRMSPARWRTTVP